MAKLPTGETIVNPPCYALACACLIVGEASLRLRGPIRVRMITFTDEMGTYPGVSTIIYFGDLDDVTFDVIEPDAFHNRKNLQAYAAHIAESIYFRAERSSSGQASP